MSGDEGDTPIEPRDIAAATDEGGSRPTRRARRRLIVSCSIAAAVLVCGIAFALATGGGDGGHRRVAVHTSDTADPATTAHSTSTRIGTRSSVAETSSSAEPPTVGAISIYTPSTPASNVSFPDPTTEPPSTGPTTTDVVTTTTLFCPEDGAGGAGCPPVSPLQTTLLSANEFSCAIAPSGQVYCWGSDDRSQLGVGPFSSPNGPMYYSLTPVAVPGMTHATAIAVGGAHACAIVPGGDVWCWGSDDLGQTGRDDASLDPHPVQPYSSYPIAVPGIHDATSVAAGLQHSCASVAIGTVWCWGANDSGQLGNASEAQTSVVPVKVSGITNAARVVANAGHTCALLTTGGIRCWGDNVLGDLGDGSTVEANAPVSVVGINHAIEIDLGATYSCALLADGHVRCWGSNDSGQLGDGTTTSSSIPVTVIGIAGARALSAGYATTCVIGATGAVWCWGQGDTGQLGDGEWTSSTTPVAVIGITNARAIAGHGQTKCAALADDSVQCWGWNVAGSLGDGSESHSNRPVVVVGYP